MKVLDICIAHVPCRTCGARIGKRCTALTTGIPLGAISLIGGIVLIALAFNQPAHADPGPTFEQECQTPHGNPDGSWCTVTYPNGKKYLVGSDDYYQNGHPLWGSEHW